MSDHITAFPSGAVDASAVQKDPLNREPNYALQYLRALGALFVMLYHASFIIALKGDKTYLSVFGEFFGEFGVALFFSLSGYLMASLSTKEPPFRFLLNRIIRIYPPYLIIAFFVLVLRYGVLCGSAFDISAFLLLPGGPHSYQLGSEWTLPFELTFYTIVFLISLADQQAKLFWFSLAWLIAMAFFQIFNFHFESMPVNQASPSLTCLPFMYQGTPFVLGLLCHHFIKTHRFSVYWLALVPFVLAIRILLPPHYMWWATGIAVTLIVAVAASTHNTRKPVEVLFQYGNWSYVLYLIHIPIMRALADLFPKTFPHFPIWAILMSVPLASASIIGRADIALHFRLKRWCKQLPYAAIVAADFVFLILFLGGGIYWDVHWRLES